MTDVKQITIKINNIAYVWYKTKPMNKQFFNIIVPNNIIISIQIIGKKYKIIYVKSTKRNSLSMYINTK